MSETGDIRIDEIMPELSNSWQTLPFEECLINENISYRKLKQSETKSHGKYPVIDQGERFISGYTDDNNDKYAGSLPVIIFGDHTRNIKYIDFKFAVGADGTKLFKPIEALIPKFFYYYLRSLNIKSQGYSRHYKFLKQINVPVPTQKEQQRIVNKLEKLLAKVETSQERLDTIPSILKRFRQSVLMQACTGQLTKDWRKQNPNVENAIELIKRIEHERIQRYKDECRKAKGQGKKKPQKPKAFDIIEIHNLELDLPEKWQLVNLGRVIYDFKYGTSNKSDYSWDGLPVIRIPNILSMEVNLDNLKYLKENDVEDNNKVTNGDLLIVRSNGSRELVGKNALVSNLDKEYAFASYLIRIKPLLMDSKYVLLLLNTDLIKEQFFSKAKSSAGINNINTEELSSTMIPLPPIEEQQEIVKRVNELFQVADKIESRYKKARTYTDKLTQSILAKAFKGELASQDSNDEPASVLLERIQREKDKLTSKTSKSKKKEKINA